MPGAKSDRNQVNETPSSSPGAAQRRVEAHDDARWAGAGLRIMNMRSNADSRPDGLCGTRSGSVGAIKGQDQVGVVVIGRNEAERLGRCVQSVLRSTRRIVYVDSASTDGSVVIARSAGLNVVEVDGSGPLTAARARNVGFEWLIKSNPAVKYVQFVDGDCEMVDGWLEAGADILDHEPELAIVAGALREREPMSSIYSRLCDIEWRQPVGETSWVGGIFMVRREAFDQVCGFNAAVVAAEDNEFCHRLGARGWKIRRVAQRMASHDAGMTRFEQWWMRCLRSGYAQAQGASVHGRSQFRRMDRESRSVWVSGLLIPLAAFVGMVAVNPWFVLLLVGHPLLVLKTYWNMRRLGFGRTDAVVYAVHCVAAKVPQAVGQIKFLFDRFCGRPAVIIEHKGPRDVGAVGE